VGIDDGDSNSNWMDKMDVIENTRAFPSNKSIALPS